MFEIFKNCSRNLSSKEQRDPQFQFNTQKMYNYSFHGLTYKAKFKVFKIKLNYQI